MSNHQVKRMRAASARQPVLRPQSSKNRKLHQKTQFIENAYISQHPQANQQLFQKNKLFQVRGNNQQSGINDISKLLPPPQKMTKERQQLFEENMHLKKQLHKLKQQLNKNKTKIQTLNSKNNRYTKQLNRQFQKKIYWTGNGNNAYLISGIKAQYQKIKQEYDEKIIQNQRLRKQLHESRAPQYKIYAEALQQQNKRLAQKLQKMVQVSENALFDDSGEKAVNQYMYIQLKNKKQKIESKFKQLIQELDLSKLETKQYKKKIEFLQKLLIEKDNAQYHAAKKAKKLQRQRLILDQKIQQLEAGKQDIEKTYSTKIEKMKMLQDRRFKAQKQMFDKALNQKQVKIAKLQKQIAYLSTLLTYWKPLDELNRDYNGEYPNQMEDQKKSIIKKQQNQFKNKHNQLTVQPNMATSKRIRRQTQHQMKIAQKSGEFVLKVNADDQNQLSKSIKLDTGNKSRVQQTADHRHSQDAEKRRKVDFKQIQHLGQHLRYRFLGLRLKINDVRKFFDFNKQTNPQANFILNEKDNKNQQRNTEWEQQYITMKEARQILKQSPFELPNQQAYMLARYMIQDSNNQYVYVDLNNQHKRSVVKSILKALVGDFQVLEGDRQIQVQKQCKQMLQKYQSNLISALSTMASSGYISRRKFLQLLSSLGIELSQQGRDFLVCKMLLKSESLNKLSYMIIFD